METNVSFSFRELDLSDVDAQGSSLMSVGDHACSIKEAELKQTASGGWMIQVEFLSQGGQTIRDRFNVKNKSADAERIGKGQLKNLLIQAAHPDPDNVGQHGIGSIRGLKVGVSVADVNEPWTDKNGKRHDTSRKVVGYFAISGKGGAVADDDEPLPF